jgi:seryl-tRNA synthetase
VIDLRQLRQDPDGARAQLARRLDGGVDAMLDDLLALDVQRRRILTRVEALKSERNKASEEVARRKRAKEPADDLMAGLRVSGDEVRALDEELRVVEAALDQRALEVPNVPAPECPEGDASANAVLRTWGNIPSFDFEPRPHWELGERLGILDLPRGAKLSGSGFPVFVGLGARLVRALENFMLDLHTREHGYVEVAVPLLLNRASLLGTGQLPKFEEDLYGVERDGLYLLPTAEVPVTNLHRDEILDGASLPRGYVASTPCFRREAGAHGKDTRGLIRVHQFDKVELVRFVRPEDGPAEHQRITAHAEAVLQRLGLPYRVLSLAAGDIGFASARTFDLEVWAPGVNAWLEVSSASTFTDFQARRANIRYRPEPGAKPEFVHTLNASGLAFPRTIIALLENGQQADGSVQIPEALAPYLGTDRLVPRA